MAEVRQPLGCRSSEGHRRIDDGSRRAHHLCRGRGDCRRGDAAALSCAPVSGLLSRWLPVPIPLGVLVLLVVGELIRDDAVLYGHHELPRSPFGLRRSTLVSVLMVLYLWCLEVRADRISDGDSRRGPLVAFLGRGPAAHLGPSTDRSRCLWRRGRAILLLLGLFVSLGQQELVISALGLQAVFAMFGLFMAATDMAELIVVGSQAAVAGLTRISSSRAFAIPLLARSSSSQTSRC